jgi:hypothetical protein
MRYTVASLLLWQLISGLTAPLEASESALAKPREEVISETHPWQYDTAKKYSEQSKNFANYECENATSIKRSTKLQCLYVN